MPTAAKIRKPKPSFVKLIRSSADATQDLLLLREDAELLYEQGKLQKLLDIDHTGQTAYCAPRNWRQICHNIWPTPHPDVLACAAKAANREITK